MPYSHPFQESYKRIFGLRVCSREGESGRILAACCRFCENFGREEGPPEKRKRTTKVKYFSRHFRSDNIKSHLRNQHPRRWTEYQEMAQTEKDTYFEDDCVGKSLMKKEEDGCTRLVFWFKKEIIECVMGEVLCVDGSWDAEEGPLQVFQWSGEEGGEAGAGGYFSQVRNKKQFRILISYIALGSTFRLASRILEFTVRETGLAELGKCDERKAAAYLRIASAANLQKLSDILKEVWAFSVALDAGNNSSVSYLDVRIRIVKDAKLYNFHVLAIPLTEAHSGEYIFKSFAKVMGALLENWSAKIIGVATDGAPSMTGIYRGVTSRIEREAHPGLYRVWCVAHQLNLVVQASIEHLCNDKFLDQLTLLIGYLRRQERLKLEMRSQCPTFADTRWLSLGKVLKWLVTNKNRVSSYLEQKQPSCKPRPSWWVVLLALKKSIDSIDAACTSIQGLKTLVSQQEVVLNSLVLELSEFANVQGPLSDEEIARSGQSYCAVSGRFAVAHADARGYLEDLGIFAMDILDTISLAEEAEVVRGVAELFVGVIDGVSKITAVQGSSNEPSSQLPPVLPYVLSKLRGREFSRILRAQMRRLQCSFSEQQISKIEEEHDDLVNAVRRETPLREALERCGANTSFQNGWATVATRFPGLCAFAGGLATVFPGTSTVESDFSVIAWEKDEYRNQLTNLSLEGILHAKQFARLQEVSTS